MSSRSAAMPLSRVRAARVNGWSTAQIRLLRDLAAQGASVSEIAKQLRRSESAIRNKAGMHGIPVRAAPSSAEYGEAGRMHWTHRNVHRPT
jgi:hypothetical protein